MQQETGFQKSLLVQVFFAKDARERVSSIKSPEYQKSGVEKHKPEI